MDVTKRKTLIEWVNSLAVAESIESLLQLQDGRHVLALTNLVEGIPQQSDIESNEKRWELILNFLEGLYQCSMTGKIDTKAVLYNCHEFEIAKVCLLVISAAMLCERNTVFVDRAMRMEVELQHEIRDMVEWVIQPNQNLADLDPSFHHVLAKKLDLSSGASTPNWRDLCAYDMKDLNPQASSTPQSCNQRSRTAQTSSTPTMNRVQQAGIGTTPVFSTSILGRFTSPGPNQAMSPMSPVQQMVQSPNMANKIRMQQKEQRIKLLERELNAKKHLVAEYESEIEEKRKDADFKDKSLIESREKLQQALKRITALQASVEDLQSQDVSMQQGPDYERMHLIINENAELTQRNKQLEEENGGLYNQLHSTQGQVDQLESIRQKMLDYQARLRESDRDLCTVRVALDEKNQLIADLSEATERAHSELTALRDTHRHELLDMHSQLERAAGAMTGAGESLGGVMEIKYTEELEALKCEMNEYEQKLQEKASHVLELLTRNEELSNEKSELSSCKDQLLGQVEQLSNSLNITQQNLSQSLETSALWEQKAHALETTLEEVQSTSTAKIAELESQISESQQENLSHLKQLAASHEAVSNLQNAMQGAHESFDQQKRILSAQIQNSEMETAKLEEALRSSEGSLQCKQDELNAVKGELQNTQETFTRELQSKDAMNSSLQGQLQSLEEKLCATHRDLSQQLEQKDAVLRDLTSEFESKKEEFTSMYKQIEHELMEQKSVNEHLEAELSMKKQEVENMQHKSEEDHQFYQAQKSEVEEQLKSKSEELTQVVGFRAQDMEEHQVQRITLEQNLNSAQQALHVKETTLEQIKTALDEAESRVFKLEEDIKENTRITENEKQELLQQLQMAEKTWDLTRVELEGSLQNKTDALSQVQQTMTQQNEEHQTRVDTLLQNLSSAQCTLESKENALLELENKLSMAESTVSQLKDELKQHEQISVDQKQELSRQLEMATMSGDEQRETVQRLSLQLQEASMKVEATENALEALRNESEEKEKMMTQHNEEHQTHVVALSQDLSSAQCTLESKENALLELENKLSVAESKISRLEDEVKQHERISADQKQELSRQLEMATMSGDEQRETVQRLSLQLQEASMKVEVTENTLEALRNESKEMEQQWNTKVDEFERTVGEICELRQQLQENEVELRQMGGQFDEVSMRLGDTEKTRDAFMTRVHELELVVKNLNSQLMESETLSEEEKTMTGQLTGQLKALEQEKLQIRQELDGECERVEAMEMELMESQQAFEMKEQELHMKIEETCLANESLQSEVINMRERTQTMEDQFELQNQKMMKLCDNLKQLGSVDQQRQKELASALEIRQQVVEDLEEAQFRITTLGEELEESKERNASLELSIQQQKENADHFEARLKEFMDDKEGEMSTLEVELTDYDDKLREAKAQVAEYKAHCDNAQPLIQSLQMELADNINKVASLEESLKVAQEALFNTEKEKQMAEEHLMQSRTSLCGKEDHLGAMQEKFAKLKEELEASAERVKELQDTLTIYEQKSADWERKYHDAETEAERKEMKLESDLERAEEEMEELNNKIALLEQSLSEAMGRLNQEGLALKEARLNESTLRQELHATRMELSTKHETLHTMEVHQAGQIEQVVTEGHAVLRGYEQKISDVQAQAKSACQQYEAQIQELHSALQQTRAVAEEKVNSRIEEITQLKQEQKEEVKVLGRQIESLSSELQSLRCWEISERTSIKELEAKCEDMEQQLAKSHKENVVLSLKLESTEKELGDLEGDQQGEKTILAEQIESIKQLETELAGVKTELMNAEVKYTEEVKKLQSEWKEKLAALEDQKQQALEQYQQVAQELEETHNELEQAKRDHTEELMDLEERCAQMQDIMENQAQRSSETASDQDKLGKKHEREVAQLKEEHFQHLAEIELNYQLEMEQIEAELLKVKSDVEHKQELLAAVQDKAASAQNDAHAELIGLEKDKLDLETKLESRDRQLKAAKHDLVRAMHVQEAKALEVAEHQKKVRQLEREIHKMMEREKRHLEAHRRETSLGADMNAKLQQQVADLNAEFAAKEQAYQGQMEEMMQQVNDMQDKYKEELEHLEEKNSEALSQETDKWSSQFDKLDDRLAKSEAARQQKIELLREAQTERDELKDQVTLLEKQLQTICVERDQCEEQLQEASNLKNQLREEEMLNKRQGNQVRSLEAQLDHATRQLKAGGRERSLVPPPQPPPFPETPANLRRSTRISSVNSQASPKSDDEFTKPYDLRSNKSSEGALSLKDIMTTPVPEGRYLSRLSFAGSMGPTPRKSPSASSTQSSTSQQPESGRTERSRSMRLSISSTSSHESMQSNSAPFVSGALFSMEDEPTEFEWDRLSELQRRNTLCLPHLKSSYPTEVQTVKPKKISELNLQKGEPLMTPVMEATETRSKSRKRTSTELSDDNNLNSRRKTFAGPSLAKSSTATLNGSSGVTLKVYPHYSPHLGNTPKHKLARSSPRGTTPAKKPSTPTATALKGPTPKGTTPKRGKSGKGSTPKPSTPKTKKSENASPKPKKTPMSFNIGFTPKKSGRLTQFLRRKKTGDGTPKVKQQTTTKKPTLTKPLGDHNRR